MAGLLVTSAWHCGTRSLIAGTYRVEFAEVEGYRTPGDREVTVEGNYAYLGYMYGPEGTTILDISDPMKPKHLSTLMLDNPQTHSHKVRVSGDIMVCNSEQRPQHGVRSN